MTVLTGEYETIKRETRKFAEKEVVPIAHDLYNEGAEIPMEIIRKMADLGYFAMAIPEQYGGLGMDTLTITLVTEELSRAWLSVGSVMTRMLIAGGLILNGGTEEQKERWLPGIASGEVLPAAAFTEPNAGSDTAGMQLRAVKQGDTYVLNGAKTWITFANRANLMTVLARTDPDPSKRHRGLSMLLVEKTPGNDFMPPQLTGKPIPTIGYYGMKSFSLNFEDFEVPAANVIGGVEGKGFYQLMGVYETRASRPRRAPSAWRRRPTRPRCSTRRSASSSAGRSPSSRSSSTRSRTWPPTSRQRANSRITRRKRRTPASAPTWRPAWPSSSPPTWSRRSAATRCRSSAATAMPWSTRPTASGATVASSRSSKAPARSRPRWWPSG